MKTIGILGGMGAMATVDIFKKIVENTVVTCDQEHIHVIVDNLAEIPDRTNYILNKDNTPLDKMIEGVKRLEQAGADILLMPCNTAHYFYDELSHHHHLENLHMIRLAEDEVKHLNQTLLLATKGTYEAHLYKNVEYPSLKIQSNVLDLIYEYKKTSKINLKLKERILDYMRNYDAVILGCTELPLMFSKEDTEALLIDPTLILARTAIKKAGAVLKDKF